MNNKRIRHRLPLSGALVLLLVVFALNGCGKPELDKIQITPGEKELRVEESVTFQAAGLSQKGEPMPEATFTWSVEGEAGTIDAAGKFTAQKPGEASVTVKSGAVSAQARVLVKPKPVARIEATPEQDKALAGASVKLAVKALAEDGKPAGFGQLAVSAATEGAQPSAATLDLTPEGQAEFTLTLAPSPGPNRVLLKADNVSQEVVIEGTGITRIVLQPEKDRFEAGAVVAFTAEGYDDFGNHKPVEIQWSLIGEHGQLQDGGQVQMQKPGTGNILVAKYENLTEARPFTVVPGALARIELTPKQIQLKAGMADTVRVEGFNQSGYPLPVDVQWSVENELGIISKDGTFLAQKVGKGQLKAERDSVSAAVEVEVTPGPLADIRIDIQESRVEAGQTLALKAAGLDAYGNEFTITPEWFLSESLGVLDPQAGTFAARTAGRGEIRAKVENFLKAHPIEVLPAALAALDITPQNVSLTAGETLKFESKGFDRFGNRVDVQPVFALTAELGELNPDGTFKAIKEGNTTLEASSGDIKISGAVTVVPAPMEVAAIDPVGPLSLTAGTPQQFKAFGRDAYGNTVTSTIAWRLSDNLGQIDTQGTFLPTKPGKGQIIAVVKDIKADKVLSIEAPVEVHPGEPARIEIQPAGIRMTAGETQQFKTIVYDAYGNPTGVAPAWRIGEFPIGELSADGSLKALKSGTGAVIATVKNIAQEAEVVVQPAEPTFLKITPGEVTAKAGERVKLEAAGEDRFGNMIDMRMVWSATDPALGTVSADNVFVPLKAGQGYLVAVANDMVEKIPVEVQKGTIASIELLPRADSVVSGEERTFTATGYDAGGNEIPIKAEWSVTEGLGRIAEGGVFTALKAGKGTLGVSADGIQATAEITVVPGPPATIALKTEPVATTAGEATPIEFDVLDANGNLIPRPEYGFSVENDLGSVNADNRFMARKAGKGTVKVTAGSAEASLPVTVAVGKVHRIEIQPASVQATAGERFAFSAKGFDSEGNAVELTPVWSVSDAIGSIDAQGQFEAWKAGEGFVSCQMEDVSGISPVQIEPGPVNRIAVEPPAANLTAGERLQLTATAYDAYNNVREADLSWSLDAGPDFGTLEAPGSFKALKAGSGKIAVAAGTVTGYGSVAVKPAGIQLLSVTPAQVALPSGEELQLAASATDAFGNLVAIRPQWSVEPSTLGTVTDQGRFKALLAGTGNLTVSANGTTSQVALEVTPGKLRYLRITPPADPIQAGKSFTYNAAGYDAGDNEIPVTVEWAVSKGIGTIEKSSGVFRPVRVGTGTVAAYSANVVASVPVDVKPGELAFIFLEPNPVTVVSDKTQAFTAVGLDVAKNDVVPMPPLEWNVLGEIGRFDEAGVFRGTRQGRGKVTVSYGSLGSEAYVSVLPGAPDSGNSRLRLNRTQVPTDGETYAEVIVEVRDAHNNGVPGIAVKLISNRLEDTLQQPPETDAEGTAIGRISSKMPGTATINAIIANMALQDTAEVNFSAK